MSATTHHGVVTLVHGNSLYLWDLDEDSPFHLSVGRASDGSRPYVGAVVRIAMEDGYPESISLGNEAELTDRQRKTMKAVIDIDELHAMRSHR